MVPSNKKLKKNIRRRTSSVFVPEIVEEGYNRVCIGNLAWDTTERDICKLFSCCVINSVQLGKNKETGEFKGCAHVDLKDSVSTAMALKLDQHVICGRPVKICGNSTNRRPWETNNVEENYAAAAAYPIPALAVPNEASNGNYFATRVVSRKIRRRACYKCKEKGHYATACVKKLEDSHDLQKNNGGSCMNETYTATSEAYSGSLVSEVRFGKSKRRTCYECREKGHLATACPKKFQNTDHTNGGSSPDCFNFYLRLKV